MNQDMFSNTHSEPPPSQGQEDTLRLELAQSQYERKSSLSKVSRSLSELSDQLDKAETSWAPWSQIDQVKQQLSTMQATVDDQIKDAKQKQEEMEGQQAFNGLMTSKQVRTLQEGLVRTQSQRRTSLTEVSRSLSELSEKLVKADSSWAPWEEVMDAKQQAADLGNVLGDQLGEVKQ